MFTVCVCMVSAILLLPGVCCVILFCGLCCVIWFLVAGSCFDCVGILVKDGLCDGLL